MKKIIIPLFVAVLLLIPIAFQNEISFGTAIENTYSKANPGDIVIFKMYMFNPGNDKLDVSINTKLPNKYWKAYVYPSPVASLPSKSSSFSCLDEKWIYVHGDYVRVCTYYLYVHVPMKVMSGRYDIVATAITNPIESVGGTSAFASQARNFVFTVDVTKNGEPVPLNTKTFVNITRKSLVNFVVPTSQSSSGPSVGGRKNYIHVGHDYINPDDRFKNVVTLDDQVGEDAGRHITAMATGHVGNIFISLIILFVGGIIIYFVYKR